MSAARNFGVIALVFALVGAACSDSDSGPTTNPGGPIATTSTTTTVPVLPTFDDDGDDIGIDDAVRIGILDNGLTYYISEND